MHVRPGELVMVREVEVLDYLVIAAEVVSERSVVCDSGEKNKPLSVEIAWISFWKHSLRVVISNCGEEDMLLLAVLSSLDLLFL